MEVQEAQGGEHADNTGEDRGLGCPGYAESWASEETVNMACLSNGVIGRNQAEIDKNPKRPITMLFFRRNHQS